MTLVKEMREKKHTRSAAPHLCIVEQRMDEERRTDSACVSCLHVCASVQACVRRDVRVCACVLGNACVRSCIHVCEADGQLCWRTIVPAHCANIDRQQVSQSQRRARKKRREKGRIQRRTLAFVRVSL